jgi:hypothetical protein
LQHARKINGANLNNVRCEARHIRGKNEGISERINKLAMKSEDKNVRYLYREINEFKRVYQPRSNLVKDENGLQILSGWKNYVSQLLNMQSLSDVRQIEIPGSSRLEFEIAIAKLKKHKSPCSDQIPAELIQAGGKTLLSEIHSLINSIWNKEELPDQWKVSNIVQIHKKG